MNDAARLELRVFAAAAILLAAAAALLAPQVVAADPSLGLLLRFLAMLKGAMALAATALLLWRLQRPVSPRLALAGTAATCAMAMAAGLIWRLQVIPGAVLFHAGLLLFAWMAWADGLVRRTLPQRVLTPTATSFLRRNGSVQGGS